jgi:putative aldouronate transport system permease protein
VLRNTILINVYKLVSLSRADYICDPLNEIRMVRFRKTVAEISYLPHFLSWVVLASISCNSFPPAAAGHGHLRAVRQAPVYLLENRAISE